MKRLFKHFTLLGFDRSFSKGLKWQLAWLVGIMCVIIIVLTAISYAGEMYAGNVSDETRLLDILFVLIDPGIGSESMSSALTIICSLLGLIIFSGMLISVISNVLERRVERYTKGETDYKISNHVVILGFNRSIPSLIDHILEKYREEDPYIIIMCNRNIEETRDWLHANIPKEHEDNIILMNGVRNTEDDIDRLRLRCGVKEIFILGEADEPTHAHDTISMQCVKKIAEKLKDDGASSKIECHVQLDSQIMFSALQKAKIDETIKEQLIFAPFNFNEIWAQKALATIPNEYKPLDGTGITKNSDKHVHLIIAGMNPLSWSLAVNAAHILHFPNFKEGVFSTCSTITFIDTEATSKGKEFRSWYRNLFDLARWREVSEHQCMEKDEYWTDPIADKDSDSPYKHLGPVNFMDIQWEFIEGDIFDKSILNYIESVATLENAITTIALCEEESDKNSSICLSLSEMTRFSANEILVRQEESDIVVNTLRKVHGFENARAFGMMNECYKENLISDKYGKLINAAYSGCAFDGSAEDNKKIESEWKEKTSLDKWSSIYCANMLFYKLRFLGLDTSKPLSKKEIEDATSEDNHCIIQPTEHNRWNTERLLLGVRPLYSEEFDYWWNNWKDKDKKEMRQKKDEMKSQMKHVDICSNDLLEKVDKPVVSFDTTLNEKLSVIYMLVSKDIKRP